MLAISPEKVFFVIVKSREFDVKVEVEEPDPGSNAADDGMSAVLQDYQDDPSYDEAAAFIDAMNEEEQINLVALAWLGRGDFTFDEWQDALAEAADARNDHTASYLLGMPLLSDHLEEGLSLHGHSCEDMEIGRL